MNALATIDLLARGGSLALLALWSWLLLRDHGTALAPRIAVAMNLCIAAHVVATISGFEAAADRNIVGIVVQLAAATVPGLFWLFVRVWFDDEARIGWPSWLAVFVSTAAVALLIANFDDRGPSFYAAAALFRVAMFAFAGLGLWIAWRGRDDDLVEARRRIRVRLAATVGAFVILVNVAEVLVYNGLAPDSLRSLIEVAILIVTFALCAAMFGIRQTDMFGSQRPASEPAGPSSFNQPIDDPLVARLLGHMDVNKPHRDEGLTISALAAQLGEQEYRLRRLINGRLGYRNFPAFLNSFRLAEVKSALADPEQREVPILTIALDAGFGSLGPFNRAFREAEGMTPSAWRAHAVADSGIDRSISNSAERPG